MSAIRTGKGSRCWGRYAGLAVAAAWLSGQPPVRAQAVQAEPEKRSEAAAAGAEAETETVIVTGSRIARSGFVTPTPVTMVNADQVARQGAANISQVLNEIPAFRPQSTPATTAIFVSNLGASTADLRGLGANRTLVLIDGRRVVASTVQGGSFTPANTVDLNLVPASLLQRAEVVTGGASAAYGSDAVAGVTNLIINRDLSGFRSTLQYGAAAEGDTEEFLGSFAWGTRFGGERGRFVVGGEYVDNHGAGDCYTRDWCAVSFNTVSNPFVAGSTTARVFAGQPATLILPNARTATASLNGLVIAGPLRGTEFNPNGTTFQHDYGTYGGAGLFQSGGGDPVLPFYQFYPLAAPSERYNILADASYALTDRVELFAQGSYGHVEGEILGASRRDVSPAGSYQIARDNAFLPASVRQQMITANVQTLPFGRIWNDLEPQLGKVERETYRAVLGLNWKIAGSLALDGYYQYGRTDYSQRGYNTTVNSRMRFAIDAVDQGLLTGGVADGNIVCRATIPNLPSYRAAAAGCVPLNPFGAGASSAAARDYVTATAMQDTELTQHVLALTLRGDLLELWAGPLSFATGLEYRKDKVDSVIDAISAANDFHTSPGGGIVGGQADLDVTEGFLELALPLAREQAFARRAELNGAVRMTDYSNSGTVETWKLGVEWEPVDWLRFRGTRSRDIRAPNLFELYGAPQSSFQTVDDPANGGVRNLVPTLLGGNTTLQPEEADTWTVGGVLTAGFGSAGALRLSLDRFDIEVDGVIATLGAQAIVARCYQGDAALCQYVTRGTNNLLTQIVNPQLNLQSLVTRGWDLEADYTLPLAALGVDNGDSLGFRVLATFLNDFITGDGVNRAGQNGAGVSQASGLPDYTINGYISYQGDPLSAQIQIRHISGGVFQATNVGPGQAGYDPLRNNSVSDNDVGSLTYVNFNMQYRLWSRGERRAELFGVVNNLFDKDPPNNTPSSFGPANNVLYDVIGRYYRAGVRFSL